jgi:anti-anti-sigma factor
VFFPGEVLMDVDHDLPSLEAFRDNDVRVLVLKRPHLLDDAAMQVHRDFRVVFHDQEPPHRVVLSLERVETISSAGIGVIFTLLKRVRQVNGQLVLCGVKPFVGNVLQLCRVIEFGDGGPPGILPVEEDRAAAVQRVTLA